MTDVSTLVSPTTETLCRATPTVCCAEADPLHVSLQSAKPIVSLRTV